MSRVGIFNLFIGFFLIFIASCYGAFLAGDSTYALLQNKELLSSWSYVLKKSSHAHTNSFGILHTLFGLTQPYSTLSLKTKAWQTCGLLAGSFTMSFLLFTRSLSLLDQASYDALGWVIGAFLSATLLALASHSFGLLAKFLKR